ncbi:MAG: glycerophosphodiester phosphodiesterase family protein, partial [Coleofasciculaceae cyanobacterium]
LAKQKNIETGRIIGIYPETKHPTYFQSINLALEEPLVDILHKNGYVSSDVPIFIQSFEVDNLQQLKKMTNLPLIQLLDDKNMQPYDFVVKDDSRTYGDLTSLQELAKIAEYAEGIGAYKGLIVPIGVDINSTTLITDAHAVNLKIHAWTFRNEEQYLAPNYQGNPQTEYEQFFKLGIDGVFSDFPDLAVTICNRMFSNY